LLVLLEAPNSGLGPWARPVHLVVHVVVVDVATWIAAHVDGTKSLNSAITNEAFIANSPDLLTRADLTLG
jgi:hypothetical protein